MRMRVQLFFFDRKIRDAACAFGLMKYERNISYYLPVATKTTKLWRRRVQGVAAMVLFANM